MRRQADRRRPHVVLASFLLGGPSGSGVATTVTLGSVAYPMLAKVGYGKDAAGGPARRGGSARSFRRRCWAPPPSCIAEFLKISYLDVILMANDPDLPVLPRAVRDGRDRRAQIRHEGRYFRARRIGVEPEQKYWFHFPVAVSIVVFMLLGLLARDGVFWATLVSA